MEAWEVDVKNMLAALIVVALMLQILQAYPSEAQNEKPAAIDVLKPPPLKCSEDENKMTVDNGVFMMEFYKSGYERILSSNGSVQAYYHNMLLEYYNSKNGKWIYVSDFLGVSWLKRDDWHCTVVKAYRDASTIPETRVEVRYNISSASNIKITIEIRNGGQARTYRLVWSLDGITYTNWAERKNADNVRCKLLFGDESRDYSWFAIDWQDIYEQFRMDVSSYSVAATAQGKKADVYFEFPSEVGAGETLTVDPYIIGTVTYAAQTASAQRKTFRANGRFWIFYSDGTNMVYRTSTDGANWGSPVSIRSCISSTQFSVWFDGTYMHYAYTHTTSLIAYRRGIPNSNGTITWTANEQVVSATTAGGPVIAVDSGGYPWIGYYVGLQYAYITKSSRNDGVWQTASGFPYLLASDTSIYTSWDVIPVPLSSGETYVLYGRWQGAVRGRMWNGTWGSEETIADSLFGVMCASAVSDFDGNVYFVHVTTSGYDVKFRKRTYGVGWGEWETIGTSDSSRPTILTIDPWNSRIYCRWWLTGIECKHSYKGLNSASWSTYTSFIEDENIYTATAPYYPSQGWIAYIYVTKSDSTYTMKSALFTTNAPPEIVSITAPATVHPNQNFYLNLTVYDLNGASNIKNASVELSYGIVLTWVSSGNVFSKASDPNGYCALNASGSLKVNVNSYTIRLCWLISLREYASKGSYSTEAKVYDLGVVIPTRQSALNLFTFSMWSAVIGPFTVESENEVTDGVWFDDARTLAFKTGGNCAVYNCEDYGAPSKVTVNGASYYNHMYDGLRGKLEIYDLPAGAAVVVSWPIPTPPPAPGNPSPIPLPTATIRVGAVNLGTLSAGAETTFQIPIEFSGASVVISKVEFESCGGWFRVEDPLPCTFTCEAGSVMGKSYIKVQISVPANATAGERTVPIVVYALSPYGETIMSRSLINFAVSEREERIIGSMWSLILFIALCIFLYAYERRR